MIHPRPGTIVQLALFLALVAIPVEPISAKGHARGGDVSVRGYTKSNGTYVAPHMRSAPDGNFWNNWTTKGNVNPYTGVPGTRVTPPDGYGGYRGRNQSVAGSA